MTRLRLAQQTPKEMKRIHVLLALYANLQLPYVRVSIGLGFTMLKDKMLE